MLRTCLLLFTVFMGFMQLSAQPLIKISGLVTDEEKHPLQQVTVTIVGQSRSAATDINGIYHIYSSRKVFTLKYTRLGYNPVLINVHQDKAGRISQDVVLSINPIEL